MNKARIVLAAVALFAVVGGALAFKAMRTGLPVITTTTRVAANGTFYTLSNAAMFHYTRVDQFFTDDESAPSAVNVLTTTAVPTAKLTLTRVGGSETITIPNFGTVTALVANTKTTSAD